MIKIDIVSGFLGAGKTTFCNLLLKHYVKHGFRPVYIVNEFGQTGLDAEIIKAENFDTIQMEGGCICCTLKDNVEKAICQVIIEFAPTHIVFEPSGVFIFDNFFDILKSDALKNKAEVGSIITVVDSLNFSFSKIAYGSFVFNQIKNSPVILISKTEKTSLNTEELLCDIKNINSEAVIITKPWNEINDDDYKIIQSQINNPEHAHYAHSHNRFQSFTATPGHLNTDDFIQRLNNMDFGNIYRVKGIIKQNGKNILLNITGKHYTKDEFKFPAQARLTFIGEYIKIKEIKNYLCGGESDRNTPREIEHNCIIA